MELDLDVEDTFQSSKVLAIGVFYSRKFYNFQYLFSDMLNVWGITKLLVVEKLGDYIFKLEFTREVEKSKVLDVGPWCHKGDAFIVIHYDDLV
jgi:hypothetical protein